MRIVKSQAVSVLKAENSMLQTQMSRCNAQTSNLSRLTLQGMRGRAAVELEHACRRHAAIAVSHLVFYESLTRANAQNIALVQALPETSSGVLDTRVAERRLNDAQSRMVALQQEMEQAIQLAERTNEEMQLAVVFVALDSAITAPPFVDTSLIRKKYESLIRAEELIVSLNRQVLDEAATYERASIDLYGSVNTDALQCSAKAGGRYVDTGMWGDDSWIGSVESAALFMRSSKTTEGTGEARAFINKFLNGDLKLERSVASYDNQLNAEYAGMPVTGAVAGSAVGLELSLKPYAKGEDPKDAKDAKGKKKKAKIGVKAEGELYAAEGEVSGSVGVAQGDAKVTALSGAVSGTVGASLFAEGALDPSLELEAKGEASALKAQTTARVGDANYNVHGKAEGKLLTASAKAGIEVSDGQIGAKAGAEAYVATGEISAGLTLVGVKVDVALEGKAGGAGAHADASVGTSSIEGSVGAGLGLGAGIKVKVDWSGAGKALARIGDGDGQWWDELGGTLVSHKN